MPPAAIALTGAGQVTVAGALITWPRLLVMTTRYWYWRAAVVAHGVIVKAGVVVPLDAKFSVTLVQKLPAPYCQVYCGGGLPLASTQKRTFSPTLPVRFAGWVVITGV